MTIVNIELAPDTVDFRIVSTKGEGKDEADKIERFVMLEGKPQYTGTYKYTDIELVRSEEKLALPATASMRISSSSDVSCAVGDVTYLEKFVDADLGISDPDRVHITITLSSEQFENLWKLATISRGVRVSAGASFKAPKTDISGHVVNWDIEQVGGLETRQLEVRRFWFSVCVPNQTNKQTKNITNKD